MDPRTGLDWLGQHGRHGDGGRGGRGRHFRFNQQFQFRRFRFFPEDRVYFTQSYQVQTPSYSQYLVEVYEPRGGQWQRVVGASFINEDAGRSSFDEFCTRYRGSRAFVRLLGLRAGARSWDELAECNVT